MRSFAALFVIVSSLSLSAVGAHGSTDCMRMISTAEKKQNGWTSFGDARVTSIDLKGNALGVELEGRQQSIYFTRGTEVCHEGKPGTLRDLRVGDRLGGFTKLDQGKTVAVILGFGKYPFPYGIPVAGKPGWVRSPYAPSQPPIDNAKVPYEALTRCPYTGKVFRNPTPPKK